jgi:hypothetical protein
MLGHVRRDVFHPPSCVPGLDFVGLLCPQLRPAIKLGTDLAATVLLALISGSRMTGEPPVVSSKFGHHILNSTPSCPQTS